jgi:hypothetical protein
MSDPIKKSPTISERLKTYFSYQDEQRAYRQSILEPILREIGIALGHPFEKLLILRELKYDYSASLVVTFFSGNQQEYSFSIPQAVLDSDTPEEAAKTFAAEKKLQEHNLKIGELYGVIAQLEARIQELEGRNDPNNVYLVYPDGPGG